MSYALIDSDVIQLCHAVRTGDVTDIKLLLQAGININCQDNFDYGLLNNFQIHFWDKPLLSNEDEQLVITENGETALHTAVWNDCEAIMQELINSGADVNQSNRNGQTPLYIAASSGQVNIVTLLLEANADVNTKTKFTEMTALHVASQNGHTDIVKILLDHGADTDPLDVINKPAKFYAANSEITHIFEDQKLARQVPESNTNTKEENNLKFFGFQKLEKSPTLEANEIAALQDIKDNGSTENLRPILVTEETLTSTNLKKNYSQQKKNKVSERGIENKEMNRTINQKKTEPSKTNVHIRSKFSPEHDKIMQMNVFDRLTRKKPSVQK